MEIPPSEIQKTPCFYQILSLSPTCTSTEIKQAYKREALKWHPDKNLNDVERSKKQFLLIAEAYEILIDEERRRRYDEIRFGRIELYSNTYSSYPSSPTSPYSPYSSQTYPTTTTRDTIDSLLSSLGQIDPFAIFDSIVGNFMDTLSRKPSCSHCGTILQNQICLQCNHGRQGIERQGSVVEDFVSLVSNVSSRLYF